MENDKRAIIRIRSSNGEIDRWKEREKKGDGRGSENFEISNDDTNLKDYTDGSSGDS